MVELWQLITTAHSYSTFLNIGCLPPAPVLSAQTETSLYCSEADIQDHAIEQNVFTGIFLRISFFILIIILIL